jgi:hypothetical protein
MKSLAVLSLFASVALAQSSSSDPLIPSGLSTSCQNFYTKFDSNTTLLQSIQPVISATASIISSSSTPSSSVIATALNSLCSSSNTPNALLYGSLLAQFYQACQAELTTSKIQAVGLLYDALYIVGPLQTALCQKDSSGKYCVADQSSNTAKRASLDRRDSSQEVVQPDASVFTQKNVALLGLSPNLTSTQLCTSCTREVMNIYTSQLGNFPYGPGISNSQLISGQPALYSAINQKCGASFLGGEVQAAGGLATGAAPRSVDGGFALVSSAIVAAAAGAVALL